ncbi:MAG: ASCH domain-containing protein, partial [Clostridia bacterium]|nr:ASCH domain-containing protein [Clostridia bacterium]
NHKEVDKWRAEQSRALTEKRRPDLAEIKRNNHEMKLENEPFEKIKKGEKKIEIRLFDEKRQKLKVGDNILFVNNQTGEKIKAEIKNLYIFESFKALYKNFDKTLLGYKADEIADAEDMTKYYSKREQKKYKAIAIEIEVAE